MIVLGIYCAALAVVFLLTRRAFGLPVLGLAVGALLANLWTGDLTPLVAEAGLVVTSPPLSSIVAIVLTLLPAFLLMTRSKRVHSMAERVVGSILFALLAVTLTYGAFANAVVLDDASAGIVTQVLPYNRVIITIGLVLALANVVMSHTHAKPGRPHK